MSKQELNEQFMEFLQTKGIKAKFKLAFSNMKESAKKQHAADVESFNEVKAKSIEQNKKFYEFLHTKGFKVKVKLVIENIKKSAAEVKINLLHLIKILQKKNLLKNLNYS